MWTIIKQIGAPSELSGINSLLIANDGKISTNKIHSDYNKFVQIFDASCIDEIVDKINTFVIKHWVTSFFHLKKKKKCKIDFVYELASSCWLVQ